MLLIRCTSKVLNLVGVPKAGLPAVELDPTEGSWFANLIRPMRRNWLLFTHSTKTNSRSVLGSMVDLAFLTETWAHPFGDKSALDAAELTRSLNRTPMSAIGYAHAIDGMKRLLQDCGT